MEGISDDETYLSPPRSRALSLRSGDRVDGQRAGRRKTTPQQQKMKDCAGKWKDEKAKTRRQGPRRLPDLHERLPEGVTPVSLAANRPLRAPSSACPGSVFLCAGRGLPGGRAARFFGCRDPGRKPLADATNPWSRAPPQGCSRPVPIPAFRLLDGTSQNQARSSFRQPGTSMLASYAKKVRSVLSRAEARIFRTLSSPRKIQDFVDIRSRSTWSWARVLICRRGGS